MAGMAMGNNRMNQGLVFFISNREAYRYVVDAASYLLSSRGDRYQVAGIKRGDFTLSATCHLLPATWRNMADTLLQLRILFKPQDLG
jgi:hypothetical protein